MIRSDPGTSARLEAEVVVPPEDLDLTPLERQRLDFTLSHVPADVENALEIGFGDGRMTRRLGELLPITALDLPHPVRSLPETEGVVFGTIESLPFADRQFDLTVCCEVLEHLPDRVLMAAVRELSRVTDRYVLITVPYRQRVWNEQYKCPSCGVMWHSSDHRRMLDESLSSLFTGWEARVRTFGETHGYAPDVVYAVARSLGNVWAESSWGCHVCKAPATAQEPNMLGFVLQRLLWRWQARTRPRPIWMLMLMERAIT